MKKITFMSLMGLILLNSYQSSAMFYGPARQAASRFTQGLGQYGQGASRFLTQGFRRTQPFSGQGRLFSSVQPQRTLVETEQELERLKNLVEQYERIAKARVAIEQEANTAARIEAEAARQRMNAEQGSQSARLATILGLMGLGGYLSLR